jgi:hypothetical protein
MIKISYLYCRWKISEFRAFLCRNMCGINRTDYIDNWLLFIKEYRKP